MNRKKLYFLVVSVLIVALSFVSNPSYALPNPSYEFYTYDEADIINSDVENYIIETNKSLYKATGAQLVVATVNSLEDMDINSYATELFDEWNIGSRELDNGMLILIVPAEGQIWIETGYGVEGAFPDSKVKRIIEDHMIPYFREDRYSDGILSGFNEIKAGLEEEYNITVEENKNINNPIPIKSDAQSGFSIPRILMVVGIIILLVLDFRFFGGILTYSLLRSLGRGRGRGGGSGGSSGGGGRSGGGGAGGSW